MSLSHPLPRDLTRPVHVGGVQIGGGAPVVVQSMTCTDTADAQATLAQVCALAQAGCDIVRVSVPTEAALEGFRIICAESPVPIVADIHFNHKMSSERFVKHFEDRGFTNIVLSAKAHSVQTTLDTYRALSREIPHVPLHLGVTEAGTKLQGTIKSSVGLGILLSEGIGDTMRVSLTADPVEEPPVAWGILQSLGLRRRGPEIVSCPTCARCQVNLIPIAEEVTERLKNYTAPLSIAVMGCAVNGPGEASDADLGVACGRGQALLFSHGQIIGKVAEDQIVDALMAEVDKLIEEK